MPRFLASPSMVSLSFTQRSSLARGRESPTFSLRPGFSGSGGGGQGERGRRGLVRGDRREGGRGRLGAGPGGGELLAGGAELLLHCLRLALGGGLGGLRGGEMGVGAAQLAVAARHLGDGRPLVAGGHGQCNGNHEESLHGGSPVDAERHGAARTLAGGARTARGTSGPEEDECPDGTPEPAPHRKGGRDGSPREHGVGPVCDIELQRDVAVLLRRVLLPLGAQHLERPDEPWAGSPAGWMTSSM